MRACFKKCHLVNVGACGEFIPFPGNANAGNRKYFLTSTL